MKEVIAIIRINKMNQTKRALAEAGIVSFHARKVTGRGKGQVDFAIMQGAQEGSEEAASQLGPGPKLIPKRMLSMVVPDALVGAVVETVIQSNRTGSPGDGKIFVCPVAEAHRIRTGESGDAVLDEAIATEGSAT